MQIANDYDEVPYDSYPYANTHPEALHTIGKLFGMEPVLPKKCRVLELGCAGGGNIIPMALKYPGGEFIGVDLSAVQIDEGKNHAEKLGIKNLALQNISLMDIDDSFGKFDYIVVHGLLSWVPRDVQDKIFDICKKNLSKNGIAYVSYNTLPGWNVIRSIREMMMYHTKRFDNPADKVSQAKLLLEFILAGNADGNRLYSDVIKHEIETLKAAGDPYLLHDHLEENNEPFYFSDIIERVGSHKLQYLGDTSVSTMFAGNFPKETAELLQQTKHDVVRAEQYMDFIRNRRFRCTLLCHNDIVIDRNLTVDSIRDFYVSPALRLETNSDDIDLTSNKVVTFKTEQGSTFSVSDAATIVAILFIIEKSVPTAIEDVLLEVRDRLPTANNMDAVERLVLDNLLRLFLADGVSLHSLPANYIGKVSDKPKVSDLSRYQSTYAAWLTSQKGHKVGIDLFGRFLVQYLDGTNDFNTIEDFMVGHILKDELSLNNNGKAVTDKEQIHKHVKTFIANGVSKLAKQGLLVA